MSMSMSMSMPMLMPLSMSTSTSSCLYSCSGPWKPGCRLSKAHNSFGETPEGREIGVGRKWGGNGEREVSLRATWGQGGRDRTTQKEGFQVSKRE
jgi:hypothetical protein